MVKEDKATHIHVGRMNFFVEGMEWMVFGKGRGHSYKSEASKETYTNSSFTYENKRAVQVWHSVMGE